MDPKIRECVFKHRPAEQKTYVNACIVGSDGENQIALALIFPASVRGECVSYSLLGWVFVLVY